MVDLNPQSPPDFEVADLNPLKPEEGLNDPNRQSLLDTFGEEGLAAGAKQLVQMVTPQSMWGNPSPGSVMSDFVEFSPIGDVRDFKSAIDLNNGLDPLERGLAVLPVFGWAGSTYAVAARMQGQVHAFKRAQAKAAREGFRSTGGAPMSTLAYAQYYDVKRDTSIDPATTDPNTLEGEQLAQYKMELEFNEAQRQATPRTARLYETSSTMELADVLLEDLGQPNARLEYIAAGLDELGRQMRQRMPDIFETGEIDAQANLNAAQVAMQTYMNLADAGLLIYTMGETDVQVDSPVGTKYSPSELGKNLVDDMAHELHRILGAVEALAGVNVGPNLRATPQFELGAVIIAREGTASTSRTSKSMSNPSGPEARVVLFANDAALPDVKLMDADGMIINKQALYERQGKVPYESMTGDMASNIMKVYFEAQQSLSKSELKRGTRWYRRANATARSVSRSSGLPLANVAGIFSALSPRSKWAPDNMVAAIHAALRFGNQELDPNSDAYKQAFIEAIKAGAWEADMYKESSKALQKQFKDDIPGLIAYYADINNMVNSAGSGIRGMAMQNQKVSAAQAAIAGMSPDMVVRMSKTNNFYAAIMDPGNPDVMAHDVWHDRITQGFVTPIEPLGSKGTRKLSKAEVDEGTYVFPSGQKLDRAFLEEQRAILKERGWSDKDIDSFLEKARHVPSDAANSRYAASIEATQAAQALLGLAKTHEMQSVVWNPAREKWDNQIKQLRQLKKEGLDASSEKVRAGRQNLVLDRSIIDHYEGNPQWQKGAVALTSNASADLSVTIPASLLEGRSPRAPTQNKAGTPFVVARRPDGTSEVWADVSNPAVLRTLRHLEPAPQKIGEWTRMVPKEPIPVRSLPDRMSQLRHGEGRVLVGEYVGNMPGNYFVFEVDSAQAAEKLVMQLEEQGLGYEVMVQDAGFDPGAATGPAEGLGSDAVAIARTNPFVGRDWVAMSAARTELDAGTNAKRHKQLRTDLENAVIEEFGVSKQQARKMVMEAEGVYEGVSESSYIVFGLPYETAMRIAESYAQDSIATRNGLIFTTGEDAGSFYPADESGFDAGDHVTGDHTAVDIGNGTVKFKAGYGDTLQTHMGNYNELMGRHSGPKPRKQVVVVLDGPSGMRPWHEAQLLWKRAQRAKETLSATAYTSGDLHRPPGTQPVYEHVFDDGVSKGTVRTQGNGGNPSAVRAYVPTHEHAGIGKATGSEGRAKLTKKAASAAAVGVQGPVPIGDVTFMAHGDPVSNPQKGLLEWEYEGPNGTDATVGFTVDLSGPQPLITPVLGEPGNAAAGFEARAQAGGATPGVVTGKVVGGEAILEAADPNDHIQAARALQSLGYGVKKNKTVVYNALADSKAVLGSVGSAAQVTISSNAQVNVKPTEVDLKITADLSEAVGAPIEFTAGDVSQETARRAASTILGLTGKDSKKKYGVTLAPHVLAKNGGNPGGIHFAYGLSGNTHGVTDVGARVQDRVVAINRTVLDAENRLGPDVVLRLERLRDRNHLVQSDGVPLSERTLIHEIGHLVATHVTHVLGEANAGPYLSWLEGYSRSMGPFGTSSSLSGYAVGNVDEFFAEAFTHVALNPNPDPRVAEMVNTVVNWVNEHQINERADINDTPFGV